MANHDPTPTSQPTLDGPGMTAPVDGVDQEGPGSVIGPYKLLTLIGEGGFGSVFLAEQERPVRRRVALKIIKLGMDTRQVVARFEQERQALAMMDHPHIAKVLDAGATKVGRPFFVMELVQGEPIVGYCDKRNVSLRERLELFAQVCAAVQHAHTKGIIHRDIKPSNVLVSEVDGKPSVKVIDFGIAKATNARLTEKTLFTEHRGLVGTPEYMSPEQAEGSADIDTRTDVYSLGVMLYELVTGSTPFLGDQLRSAAYGEMQRIIREVDPPRPSARLSQSGATLATIAARRRVEPAQLEPMVRGELDWIVMKAMEKERSRRYETARGLALDIERYLSGDAVSAVPPSAGYRLKTFVRRHRVMVAAGGLVTAALLLGVAGTTAGMIKANRAREAAVLSEQEARTQAQRANTAEQEAKARLDESEATVKFLDDMLAAADPATKGKDVPVRAILDEASGTVGTTFADRPRVAARLHATIGRTYVGLGAYDVAESHMRNAYAIRKRELGENSPDTCNALNDLCSYMVKAGLPEAEETIRRAIAQQESLFGRRHLITLKSVDNLVLLMTSQSRANEAVDLAKEVMDGRVALLGENNLETVAAINSLATVYAEVQRADESESLFDRAIEAQRALAGPEHPYTLTIRGNLAWMLYWTSMEEDYGKSERTRKRLERAKTINEEVLQARLRVLGEDHQDTLTSLGNLRSVYAGLGLREQAVALGRREVEASVRVLGEEHPDTLVALANFGNTLRGEDRCDEALPYLERAVRGSRKVLPAENPGTAYTLGWYGSCLASLGRFADGEAALLEAHAIITRIQGEDSRVGQQMAINLTELYEAWDKSQPGKGYAEKATTWRARGPK